MTEIETTSTQPFAVVTGASSGIGRELARQFAEHGYRVLVTAENDAIADAARELGAEHVRADLSRPEGVEALYARIREAGVPVDAIAINAGVGHYGRFDESDLEGDLDLIRLNVVSAVHLAKLVVRDMAARGRGRILFTSSIASTMPGPLYATYAASKAFLQSFSQALTHELKDKGITVTSLMPGPTDTEFFERAGMRETKVGQGDKDDPALVAKQGFEALMAGKDHVVAGSLMNRVQAGVAKVLPEQLKATLHRKEGEKLPPEKLKKSG